MQATTIRQYLPYLMIFFYSLICLATFVMMLVGLYQLAALTFNLYKGMPDNFRDGNILKFVFFQPGIFVLSGFLLSKSLLPSIAGVLDAYDHKGKSKEYIEKGLSNHGFTITFFLLGCGFFSWGYQWPLEVTIPIFCASGAVFFEFILKPAVNEGLRVANKNSRFETRHVILLLAILTLFVDTFTNQKMYLALGIGIFDLYYILSIVSHMRSKNDPLDIKFFLFLTLPTMVLFSCYQMIAISKPLDNIEIACMLFIGFSLGSGAHVFARSILGFVKGFRDYQGQ